MSTSGTLSVPIYNDDNVPVTVRSKDNSAKANNGSPLGVGKKTTIELPRDAPTLVVVRTGKQDVQKHWNNTNEFRPARDAPATD